MGKHNYQLRLGGRHVVLLLPSQHVPLDGEKLRGSLVITSQPILAALFRFAPTEPFLSVLTTMRSSMFPNK